MKTILLIVVILMHLGCATESVRENYAQTKREYVISDRLHCDVEQRKFAVYGATVENGREVDCQISYAVYLINDQWLDGGAVVVGQMPNSFIPIDVVDVGSKLVGVSPEYSLVFLKDIFAHGQGPLGFRFIKQEDGLYYVNFLKPGTQELVQINKMVGPPTERKNYVKWYRYPDLTVVYILAGTWDIVTFPFLLLSMPFWPEMNR